MENAVDWRTVATITLGLAQALVLLWMRQSAEDRERIRDAVSALQKENAELRAHMGVDGNGIMARLDTIEHKLDRALNELAEQRGAQRGRA